MRLLLNLVLLLAALPALATNYYVDVANGSDAAAGTSFGAAWKSLNHTLTGGDKVFFAKSSDPTGIGSASWTNGGRFVILNQRSTTNIDNCEKGWTASANVTSTTSTTRKEGAASTSIAIAGGFTTGLAAYTNFTTMDLSAYQQVSFWVRANAAVLTNNLSLRLCSDTAGVTTVNTLVIPPINAANQWQVVTVDNAGALGSSIQSLALYADIDPGAVTLLIDNVIACPASSATNSLNLKSMIGKGTAAENEYYPIQSISNTVVVIDNHTENGQGSGRGYSGVTEAVLSNKRETINTTNAAAASTQIQLLNNSGAGSAIFLSGGWDTSNTNQTGQTWLDGQNGFGYGLYGNGKTNIAVENMSFVRYDRGVELFSVTGANDWSFTNTHAVAGTSFGAIFSTSYRNQATNFSAYNCGGAGLRFDFCAGSIFQYGKYNNNLGAPTLNTVCSRDQFNNCNFNNNTSYGMNAVDSLNCTFAGCSFSGNTLYGVNYTSGGGSFYNCITTNNTTGGMQLVNFQVGPLYLFNTTISESTEFTFTDTGLYSDMRPVSIYSDNHDNTLTNSKVFGRNFTVSQDMATVHTAGGASWNASPTSAAIVTSLNPVQVPIGPFTMLSNVSQTITLWVYRNVASSTAQLFVPASTIPGVTTNVTATASGTTNAWEQLSVTFTPTNTVQGTVYFQTYGGITNTVWFDDPSQNGTNYAIKKSYRAIPLLQTTNTASGGGGSYTF